MKDWKATPELYLQFVDSKIIQWGRTENCKTFNDPNFRRFSLFICMGYLEKMKLTRRRKGEDKAGCALNKTFEHSATSLRKVKTVR